MLKISKTKLIITSIVILIPIAVGLILWNRLPETMVTHWGVGNVPNGWSSKAMAVFGLPAILLAVHWVCLFATKADPKSKNINPRMLDLVLWICPVLSIVLGTVTYSFSLGYEVNVQAVVTIIMGVLFVVVGNYLPKCKQSYTMGIKLPWTLSDEENWNKTHRLAGKLWVAGGIILLATSFLQSVIIMVVVLVLLVIIPTVYSYILYRKKKKG